MTAENMITRADVLEAKERLSGEDKDVFGKYLNKIASYTKQEASEKQLSNKELRRLNESVLDTAFPEKNVDLLNVRRAIRREFHKKNQSHR